MHRSALAAIVAAASMGCSATADQVRERREPEPMARSAPLRATDLDTAAQSVDPPAPSLAKESRDEPKPPPAPPDRRARIGSIDDGTKIYVKPERKGLPLGYVRIGTSVPLLSPDPVPGNGCTRGGWYAVAPRGYLCLDRTATKDLDDPYFRALATVAPVPGGVWYYHYAFSNGAPMYSRVPTADEQERAERDLGPRRSYVQLGMWSHGHEELITDEPIQATDPMPDFFANHGRPPGGRFDPRRAVWRVIPNGSMLAYAKAFEADGRVWLVTPDLMIVPADRVRAIRRSTFHGVSLTEVSGDAKGEGKRIELPLAWNRAFAPKPKYRRDGDGHMVPAGEQLPPKSPVPIVDTIVVSDRARYLPLRDGSGLFVAAADVVVTRARQTMPQAVAADSKWLEVRITPGTLTAYEGLKAVYATLFSPGKGGPPKPGFDPYKYSMTNTGVFPIEWKDRVATMSPDKGAPTVLWFSDVPHIQYLRAPLAMHVSFWHEDFGNPKSAECVNVSPIDGKWLFEWTDPKLPEGWGGIRPGGGNGDATPVVITGM
jgi:hypothetical protein